MLLDFAGSLPLGVTAKDVILGAIGRIGIAGGAGHVVEYAGEVIRSLSMEGRMTICNMSIEAGRACRDDRSRRHDVRLPQGPPGRAEGRGAGSGRWTLAHPASDPGAAYDRVVELDVRRARAAGQLGDKPGQVVSVDGVVPDPSDIADPAEREAAERALAYMALEPGTPIAGDRGRSRLHRLLHERAHRGPARGSRGRRRASASMRACGDGRPGLGPGEAPGRGGGARPSLRGRRASSGGAPAAPCALA